MDGFVLIVVVLVIAGMMALYLRWLHGWWFRLAAIAAWTLFLGAATGAVAASYGVSSVDSGIWLLGMVVGLAGGLAVHVLNNRYIRQRAEQEQARERSHVARRQD